jgi:hypothetical protein
MDSVIEDAVDNGIRTLGLLIEINTGKNPTKAGVFENDVFSLRYNCDCEGESHQAFDCPAVFLYKGDIECSASWYRHFARGFAYSLDSPKQWAKILADCIQSLNPE